MIYCPKCASTAVEGQRFCRSCGTNLGVILDAMEGKRGPLDFETLKRDLRDLGSSLRSGFEEASAAIKNTKRLDQRHVPSSQPQQVLLPDLSKELKKAVRKVNAADSRKLSLQKGTLSLFGGGVFMYVWYHVLEAATRSEVISNLERIIVQAAPQMEGINIGAFAPLVQTLWLLGLIPVAKGVAYLVNAIFFAPKPEPEPAPQIIYSQPVMQAPPNYASSIPDPSTNELENQSAPRPGQSVTEDATLRFEPREAK